MSERTKRLAAAVKKGISYILSVTDGASGKAGNSTGIASTSTSTSSFQHGAYVPHAIRVWQKNCLIFRPRVQRGYVESERCWGWRLGTWRQDKGRRRREECCFSFPNLVSLLNPDHTMFMSPRLCDLTLEWAHGSKRRWRKQGLAQP